MSSKVLAANKVLGAKVLAVNQAGDVGGSSDEFNNESKRVEPKTRRSENQKSANSLKSSKSRNLKSKKSAKFKKPSKIGNASNFNAKKAGQSFLTPKARSTFNRLWLAFTKASILHHFDPEYHIWIKTNALGYTIDDMLSQLASEIKLDRVVTKTDLGQQQPVKNFSKKLILAET